MIAGQRIESALHPLQAGLLGVRGLWAGSIADTPDMRREVAGFLVMASEHIGRLAKDVEEAVGTAEGACMAYKLRSALGNTAVGLTMVEGMWSGLVKSTPETRRAVEDKFQAAIDNLLHEMRMIVGGVGPSVRITPRDSTDEPRRPPGAGSRHRGGAGVRDVEPAGE